MITAGAPEFSGHRAPGGRLPCCHGNNLQPWPWARVRGQREVTAEAMITVKRGPGMGCWGGFNQRGWDRRLTPEKWWKMSSTDGIIDEVYEELSLY